MGSTLPARGPARARSVVCLLALLGGAAGFVAVRRGDAAPLEPPAAEAGPLERIQGLIDAGSFAEAERRARERLAAVEAERGADSLEAAEVMDLLVRTLVRLGRASEPETLALAERALAVRRARLDAGDVAVATSLVTLGSVFFRMGEFDAARSRILEGLAIKEARLGPDHPDLVAVLNQLGIVLRNMGETREAKQRLERALAVAERSEGPDGAQVGLVLNTLGSVLSNLGDDAGARRAFERCLSIREKRLGPDHPQVAQAAQNLGVDLWQGGDWSRARALFERSLAIQEKVYGPHHPEVALTLGNLANLLADLGDRSAARKLYERAAAVQEKTLGPEHPELAATLGNLASLSIEVHDWEGAVSLLSRAFAIREKALDPGHPDLIRTMAVFSRALAERGDLARARGLAGRALEAGERRFGPRHPGFSWILLDVAKAHRSLGDLPASQALLARALSSFEAAYGPSHLTVAGTLAESSIGDWEAGDVAAARAHSLRAKRILRALARDVAHEASEREALLFQAVWTTALDVALTAAVSSSPAAVDAEAVDETWDELVRSRALVLDEMAARHRALRALETPEATALQESLARARSRLARLVTSRAAPDDPAEASRRFEEALHEKERLERLLAEKSAAFRRRQTHARAGLAEVVSAIPDGAALISFARFSRLAAPARGGRAGSPVPSYLAFVLEASSGGSRRHIVALGPAGAIEDLVHAWQEEASRPARDREALARYRAAGEALRRAVWDPVAGRIGAARRVFVVMDGTLNLVNVGTLPAAGGGYLIESRPDVHYLSAERDLVSAREAREPGRGVLVMGGPDFDATADPGPSAGLAPPVGGPGGTAPEGAAVTAYRGTRAACGAFRSLRFDPLPGAGAEAVEVARLLSSRRPSGERGANDLLVLTGARATEAAFKLNAPGRRILHLATHGFFVQDRCESRLDRASSGDGADTWASDLASGENPLLLSGLALAGANQRNDAAASGEHEDGILTAEEIASLDLGGVEWAVLSACGTGLGPVQTGEGVLGMRRTFEVAGARGLVLSLWPIEDHLARDWIQRLYDVALGGSSPVEAARRAALEVLAARRRAGVLDHPYFWGAFVATGG